MCRVFFSTIVLEQRTKFCPLRWLSLVGSLKTIPGILGILLFGFITKNVSVLNNLNFDIPRGKITTILGFSGAGKSTLLKILGATIKPDSGSLSILEHDLDKEYKQIRKMSGYFYAGQPFFEYLNVAEHLEYFAKLKGVANSVKSENIFELTAFFQINPKNKN